MAFRAAAAAPWMPLRSRTGLVPAATFFIPSRTMAWARTTAVVAPSPTASLMFFATCFKSWTPRSSAMSLS